LNANTAVQWAFQGAKEILRRCKYLGVLDKLVGLRDHGHRGLFRRIREDKNPVLISCEAGELVRGSRGKLRQAGCRKSETTAEWEKITKVASTLSRAPWLDLRSRSVSNWFGVLEAGLEHDDHRFRRAVYLRTGAGFGHQDSDSLDLQLVAQGLPMTVDDGERSGYSKPSCHFTKVHNTVDVPQGTDEYGVNAYGWTTALSDSDGARYLAAQTTPFHQVKLYRRQIALIDVDEGKGGAPTTVAQQILKDKLPAGVVTPNSYVFDVFRVSGAKNATYCFHGPVSENFEWNAMNVKPVAHQPVSEKETSTEAGYLAAYELSPESKKAGDSPDILQATWRYSRRKGTGSEESHLGLNYDPTAPARFTRLHLLGAGGFRAMKADAVCDKRNYRLNDILVRDPKNESESLFTALIEPYSGTPFITGQKLLVIPKNETDALRATAVEVRTQNGHVDLCFADGRPEKIRQIQNGEARFQISGEFAFHSTDAEGLRQVELTGGTLMEGAGFRLQAARREHTATITKVDYARKTFWTDKPLPAGSAGRILEMLAPGCPDSHTITSIVSEGTGSKVTLTLSADFYRSKVGKINAETMEVDGDLSLSEARTRLGGMTLSNDSLTRFWRIKENTGKHFMVDGAVTASDFSPSDTLRIWEYGVGDKIRLATFASARRIESGAWEVMGDTDLEITLKGKTRKFASSDLLKGPVQIPAM
jgi:hypothetical protein